jgi:hypothetical protein
MVMYLEVSFRMELTFPSASFHLPVNIRKSKETKPRFALFPISSQHPQKAKVGADYLIIRRDGSINWYILNVPERLGTIQKKRS